MNSQLKVKSDFLFVLLLWLLPLVLYYLYYGYILILVSSGPLDSEFAYAYVQPTVTDIILWIIQISLVPISILLINYIPLLLARKKIFWSHVLPFLIILYGFSATIFFAISYYQRIIDPIIPLSVTTEQVIGVGTLLFAFFAVFVVNYLLIRRRQEKIFALVANESDTPKFKFDIQNGPVKVFIGLIIFFGVCILIIVTRLNNLPVSETTCINHSGHFVITYPKNFKYDKQNCGYPYGVGYSEMEASNTLYDKNNTGNTPEDVFRRTRLFIIKSETSSLSIEEYAKARISLQERMYAPCVDCKIENGALDGSVKVKFVDSKWHSAEVWTFYKKDSTIYTFTLSEPTPGNLPNESIENIYDNLVKSFHQTDLFGNTLR